MELFVPLLPLPEIESGVNTESAERIGDGKTRLTIIVGMEARLAPQFSVRAGYNYTSAAFTEDAYSALPLYRTSTDFNNIKDKNTLTFGLGYRGNVVYADLAYKYDMYKSDFYAFDDIDLPATKVDNSRNQLVFTLGARF